MKNKVSVLIVDDSAFMRKIISDFINSDDRLHVIGTARNGKDALKKIEHYHPDVVTMDVEMPVMNGIDALKQIMRNSPLPVVMLSSTTREGAENTVKAIQYGAVEFIAKPSGAISLDLDKVKEEIVNKVFIASKANLTGICSRKSLPVKAENHVKLSDANRDSEQVQEEKTIICIGTSTGGPRALQQVLTEIPKDINAPILVVQHMPPGFTKSLAQRLDSICEIQVKEAEEGDVLQKGIAYIGPGGFHLRIKSMGTSLAIQLDQSTPPINGHRPSVNVMFESISSVKGFKKISVIMTGMGADGTEGLKKLKEKGNTFSIAESKESSIVFGMPKAAISTNLIDEVVHLNQIASMIVKHIS